MYTYAIGFFARLLALRHRHRRPYGPYGRTAAVVTTDAEASLTEETQASVRHQRETISGIQARNMDKAKRPQKLENEDGQPTVQEFLRLRETDFIAFAIEGTGALGPAVDPFIKQVTTTASPAVPHLPFAGTGTPSWACV